MITESIGIKGKPKFPLGKLAITRGAEAEISLADVQIALSRHVSGDWGEMPDEDKRANDRGLNPDPDTQDRLFSAYHGTGGVKFWIITERDRSVTTILLPDEY